MRDFVGLVAQRPRVFATNRLGALDEGQPLVVCVGSLACPQLPQWIGLSLDSPPVRENLAASVTQTTRAVKPAFP